MAPSPETDAAGPKAPDKGPDADRDAKTLSNLNDEELKALLDEAINYKNPKDKEGKSKLFKNLLSKAVEDERKNRATSAGGVELVRYYNTSAKRNGGRHGRRKQSSSVSENVMHGGSLDNLAKEELYEADRRHRTRKNVSARQREGGSLPCNVNSGGMSYSPSEYEFLREAGRKGALNREFAGDVDVAESIGLLEDDSLAKSYQETVVDMMGVMGPEQRLDLTQPPQTQACHTPVKFTSKATLQVANVDDAIQLPDLDGILSSTTGKKTYDVEIVQNRVQQSQYNVYIPTYNRLEDPVKKVDENGNALQQQQQQQAPNSTKTKKKAKSDKNVVVLTSENVEGHRGDIINDIPKLVQFIGGFESTNKQKSVHKSKLKQHNSEDGGRNKKQRPNSTKNGKERSDLKKSNSLGEISTNFQDFEESLTVERRSWGTVEPPAFAVSCASSNEHLEHLEGADNWIETKCKKKSKKRRNSTSGQGTKAVRTAQNRAPSPDLRKMRKSATNSDSSDNDSVHSLPIDGLKISYADKVKDKRSPEVYKVPNEITKDFTHAANALNSSAVNSVQPVVILPPDVTNFKSFPAIKGPNLQAAQTQNSAPIAVDLPKASNTPPKTSAASVVSNSNKAKSGLTNNTNSTGTISNNNNNSTLAVGLTNTISTATNTIVSTNNSKSAVGKTVSHQTTAQAQLPQAIVSTNVHTNNNTNTSNNVVSNNNNNNNNKTVCTNDNNTKSGGAAQDSVCRNDINIQNDLSIIQANEKEHLMQLNAQRLPPNILDVSSIEKRFLSQNHQRNNNNNPNRQRLDTSTNNSTNTTTNNVVDLAVDEETASGGGSDSEKHQQPNGGSPQQLDLQQQPPVVILSGSNNKEVAGLVFGFDINEQLLSEDVCDQFVSRFVCPKFDRHTHDKIVNFIGISWDSVINQSTEPTYYMDGL